MAKNLKPQHALLPFMEVKHILEQAVLLAPLLNAKKV